jgi:hypothetical protein
MTLDELLARESIRQTLARYNIFGDRVRVDEFLEAFTEDAVLEFGGEREGQVTRHEGRAAIRGWMTDWKSAPPSRAPEPKPAAAPVQMFVRHHISTSHVEFTGPDTAEGRTYFAVYTPIGPDHAGVYTDRFRKTGDRWLISHRKVRTEWRAENSFFQQKRGDEQ